MAKMNEADLRHRLEQLAQVQPSEEAARRATQRVRDALMQTQERPNARIASLWRTIMKNRMTKPAVAAAIAIATLVGISLTGQSSVAFADIVQPFLTARTATFKMTMEVQGAPTQTFDCMYAEPIRMRQATTDGSAVVISDLLQGRIVTLIAAQKQAVVMEITNISDDPNESQFNLFGQIRRHIQEAQEAPDDSVTSLGERQIEGRAVVGYRVQKSGVDMTIWADKQTQLPIEIKSVTGPTTYTMTEIVFDVDLDESLFDLTIPEGYEVGTLHTNAAKPTEMDLLDTFHIWAEHTDGGLPSSVDMNAPMAFALAQRTKMMQTGQELSRESMLQLQQTIMDMSRGLTFVQQLPVDSDWHYAGKDVTFGDAETPIFWYRSEGAETYRVIYGDLSIDEVPASERPAGIEEKPASDETSPGQALVDEAVAMGADIPPEKRGLVTRMLNLSEEDLIAGLKAFADLSGGRYPRKLDAKSTMKETDGLGADVLRDTSKEAREQKIQDIFFATAFHDKLVREKKDVTYHGDAVTARDGDEVLMRWKIADGKYRVVFGDLTAKDVTPDELKRLEWQ